MIPYVIDVPNEYGALAFQGQASDLLAVLRLNPEMQEGYLASYDLAALQAALVPETIVPAASFSCEVQQPSTEDKRLVGEGAESANIHVHTGTIRATIKFSLIAPVRGWIDPVFATFWDLAKLGWWGTPSTVSGALVQDASVGASELFTDNAAEFRALTTPFQLDVLDTADPARNETLTVTAVDKRLRRLTLQSAATKAHPRASSVLFARVNRIGQANAPERPPTFALYSEREGLLAPCVVDKLTLEARADDSIEVTVEIVALSLRRDRQIIVRQAQHAVLANFSRMMPAERVMGVYTTLEAAAAQNGTFGLPSFLGDPLFGGFQGLDIDTPIVEEFSLTVDNHLQPVYALHSAQSGAGQYRDNRFPLAYVSEGRTVGGSMRYRSPLEPWALAERLAGPSSLAGGGISVGWGTFTTILPEVAWSPSKSEGQVEQGIHRTLDWQLVASTRDAMPTLGMKTLA